MTTLSKRLASLERARPKPRPLIYGSSGDFTNDEICEFWTLLGRCFELPRYRGSYDSYRLGPDRSRFIDLLVDGAGAYAPAGSHTGSQTEDGSSPLDASVIDQTDTGVPTGATPTATPLGTPTSTSEADENRYPGLLLGLEEK